MQELLRMEHISRAVSGKRLLRGASINVRQGEVVGLLGLNGSGKSMLMEVACGLSPCDSGNLYFNEQKLTQLTVNQATALGIHYLRSVKSLYHDFSIMENIFYMRSSQHLAIFNQEAHYSQTKKLLHLLHLNHSPNKQVSQLNLYEKLLVLVAKTIHMGARLLVFDNIVTQLSGAHLSQFTGILKILLRQNISVILVDHKPEYLVSCCDRIFVMREKTTVGEFEQDAFLEQKLMSVLIGRDYIPPRSLHAATFDASHIFALEHICKSPVLTDLTFSAAAGEIVGLCTKSATEATAITNLMFGKSIADSGQFSMCGKPFTVRREADMIHMGIGTISESNETFENLSLYENIMLIAHQKYVKHRFFIDKKQLLQNFNDLYYLNFYDTIFLSKNKQCKNLDKLMQKQICMFRHLVLRPKVLFFHDPFLNFDVLSSEKLMHLFAQLSEKGISILLQSPNINNLLPICHKIIFVDHGATVCEMPTGSANYPAIMDFSKNYYL